VEDSGEQRKGKRTPERGGCRIQQEKQEREAAGRRHGHGGWGEAENLAQTLKVMYANAQSIKSKLDELKAVTQDLKPDIILLTETWCNNTIENAALTLENYKLETDLRRDRNDTANGIGGGLLVYSKDGTKILPYDKFQNNSFNQFCTFSVVTRSEKLHIVLIYRPPSSGLINLAELCKLIRDADENTIFIGDFNRPGIDWERETSKEAKAQEFLEAVVEGGLQQLVNFPTHTKGNVLDLILTDCPDKILQVSDAGRLGRSDHCILNTVLDFQPNSISTNTSRYNWSKANTDMIKSDLDRIHWRETLNGKSVEDAWGIFRDTLSESIEKNVPKCGNRTRTHG